MRGLNPGGSRWSKDHGWCTFALRIEIREELKPIAERLGVTVNWLINQAVKMSIPRLKRTRKVV